VLFCYSRKKRLQNYYFLRTQPNKTLKNRRFLHISSAFVQPGAAREEKNCFLFVLSANFSYLCSVEGR